jgi:hypothetical protein
MKSLRRSSVALTMLPMGSAAGSWEYEASDQSAFIGVDQRFNIFPCIGAGAEGRVCQNEEREPQMNGRRGDNAD